MALKYEHSKYLDFSGALQVISDIPLDIRNVVSTELDLITASTWYKNGTDSTTSIAYTGMLVSVAETGDVYICTNASDPTSLTSWKKLASASDLSGLSGVFQFKGVAEAISPDQRIITTRGVATATVTDAEGKVITDSEPLYCVTTAYEFDMDVYYGWGTSLNDIRFWTDTPTVNSNTTQYDKGGETSITAYEFDGELYYPIDSTVAPTAGDHVTPYESVGGRVIYIAEGGDVHDDSLAAGGPIGEATLITYMGCDFSVKESIALEENTTSETITASPDNSGHVYQIGENEYASNGTIWVKLGSPVEDWIIL